MDITHQILKLNLPADSFVVVGSGILNALGIRPANDIDMIVSPELFDRLAKAGWSKGSWVDQTVLAKGKFDIGQHWMGDGVDKLLQRATVIDGIPYLSLTDLLAWKIARARPKDLADVQLINDYVHKIQS